MNTFGVFCAVHGSFFPCPTCTSGGTIRHSDFTVSGMNDSIIDLERQLAEARAEIAELKKSECEHVKMRQHFHQKGQTTFIDHVPNLHCPLCGERLVSE